MVERRTLQKFSDVTDMHEKKWQYWQIRTKKLKVHKMYSLSNTCFYS